MSTELLREDKNVLLGLGDSGWPVGISNPSGSCQIVLPSYLNVLKRGFRWARMSWL